MSGQIVVYALMALVIAVHGSAAVMAYADARAVQRSGQQTWPLGAGFWGPAVLLTGVLGLGVYWLIHRSSLGAVDRSRVANDERRKISPADDGMLNEDLLRIQERHRRRPGDE